MRLIDADALDYELGTSDRDIYVRECLAEAPSVTPEPHWIPVTERMPETEGDYLITDDSGGVKTIEVDSFFILDDGKKMWCYSQNPVAWMELPEAYKGETE